MEYLDVPLLLLSLAIVLTGQAIWSALLRKRRAVAAMAHQDQYFHKLQVDCQKRDEGSSRKIHEINLENRKLEAKLDEFGFNLNQLSQLATEKVPDLERRISQGKQEKAQVKLLEDEISATCSRAGLDPNISQEDLKQKIIELQSENERLESQLDNSSLPTENTDMDHEIEEFMMQEGRKYSLEQLDELYEKLLEEKLADPSGSLDAYEARIKNFDYDAEHLRLDLERKRVEMIHERSKRCYLESAEEFNRQRIEYMLKIHGAAEELKARRELNDVSEKLLRTLSTQP